MSNNAKRRKIFDDDHVSSSQPLFTPRNPVQNDNIEVAKHETLGTLRWQHGPHYRAAGLVVFARQKDGSSAVLMLNERRKADIGVFRKVGLMFPGGKRMHGVEHNPWITALREFTEETRSALKHDHEKLYNRFVKRLPYSAFYHQDGKYYVLATRSRFRTTAKVNDKFAAGDYVEDHTHELVWIPTSELRDYIDCGRTLLRTVDGRELSLHNFASELISNPSFVDILNRFEQSGSVTQTSSSTDSLLPHEFVTDSTTLLNYHLAAEGPPTSTTGSLTREERRKLKKVKKRLAKQTAQATAKQQKLVL